MKVSLNWIKKYVDLPDNITNEQIAKDLTLRTVEVESFENTADKFHDIIVGKIIEVKKHPNADLLKVCMVEIGEKKPVQIVCGGSNLYENEKVVVCKPGAEVFWHGESELVKIKETKMRGEDSYGMICGAEEVYLEDFFPAKDEKEIVDLSNIECEIGQNISSLVCMEDTILEIDNKSLSNRPDLWGHYGVAREIATIYNVPLKELPSFELNSNVKEYKVDILEKEKCKRYVGIEIDGVYEKSSPMWMQALLINGGMRPINAIVDITNYVMLAVGQPLHAFDRTHVEGGTIVVRNAKKDEKLLLLDNNYIDLTENDLVICDSKDAMALAGIRGGKKDSILPKTTGIVLEVANFSAETIRKTGKRFDEKTDASIRYEKGLDTQRVDQGISLALSLFKELFEDSRVISYKDNYPASTKKVEIDVPQKFLDDRVGVVLDRKIIERILKSLGYEIECTNDVYHVIVPSWRSTGDVSLKDDVMGDLVRLLGFDSFEATPINMSVSHAVLQNNKLLERRIREYLANRCGFNEIITYPWIDEKYINAAKIDKSSSIKLATPPSPEQVYLRNSLIPGLLEAISKNLRYYDEFKLFEMSQVYEKGEYRPSTDEEILPIHKKLVSGCIVNKNAKDIFYEIKGIVEYMSEYTHMENLSFEKEDKPSWADVNAYLSIKLNEETIGHIGLLSVSSMNESKIKGTNVALFEFNFDKLITYPSRTNAFEHLPQLPLVEKDLSLLVDENVTWKQIEELIKNKVKQVEFVEEYRGNQVPEGKKSIMLRVKIENEESTMTSEQINAKMETIVKTLNKMCGAILREE